MVTGGAGFIGSHLCERLLSDGHDVLAIDNFAAYYPRRCKEENLLVARQHHRFSLVEVDLMDAEWPGLLDGINVVFHLAAQPGVRGSWGTDFAIYVRNNILATQRLLEATRSFPLHKFVYASSSSVYGDAELMPTAETVTPMPVSPYGVSKLAGEHLCNVYSRNFDIPTVSLRFFTVYGPRQRPDMAFYRFIQSMFAQTPIPVYGDGTQTRDFTYVLDIVEGIVGAAGSHAAGEIFNLGGGTQVSVNEVLDLLEHLIGRTPVRHYSPSQEGDVRHTGADISKARRLLRYEPKFDLKRALQAQISWLNRSEDAGRYLE